MSSELDGLFDGFNTDLDPNAKNHSRPDLGRGAYMLSRYYLKPTFKQGNILVADFVVVQPATGSTRQVGDHVSLAWYIAKPGLPGQYEKARAAEMVTALLGLPPKSDAGGAAKRLRADDQPGTGIMVWIIGEMNGKYLNHKFEHIPGQTGETIAANRAKVMQMAGPVATPPPVAPTTPPPAAPPYPAAAATPPPAAPGGFTIPGLKL